MAFTDLDALIGDIRREAARRRAAPDFPVDDEARLALEMDRQGPSGGAADLPAVLDAIRLLVRADPAGSSGTEAGPAAPDGAPPRSALADLADLTGSALRVLHATVADLQRQVERLGPSLPLRLPPPGSAAGAAEASGGARDRPGAAPPGDAGVPGELAHWAPVVAQVAAGAAAGRVLVAGPGAGWWARTLAAGGADSYAVDPTVPLYGDDGMVRTGGVAAHLQTVPDGALALAVLVGPLAAAELPHLDRWAAAVAARSPLVVIVSEAPWAWRLRLGEAGSDISAWRPAAPETWMTVLDRVGYRLSGRYGPGGRDYCVAGSAAGLAGTAPGSGPEAGPEL